MKTPTVRLPGRTYYHCSGRVTWSRFFPAVLALLAASAAVAALLMLLFVAGCYYVLIVPLLAALVVGLLANWAVGQGQCRNPLLAAVTGCVAGIILYFGYYYAGMIHHVGAEAAQHPEWLPRYIRVRMATQVIRHTGDPENRERRSDPGREIFNWIFFGLETAVVLGLTTAMAYRRTRTPFCETCSRWMTREITTFEPDKAPELVKALEMGSAEGLAKLCAAPVFATFPNTSVALDSCPSLKEGTARDCPVFISIKSVTAMPGGAKLDPFETAKGKVLVRGAQVGMAELPAFAPRFAFLENFVGRSAVAALVPKPETSDSGEEQAGVFIEIKPIESEHAGKVLTRKTALIGTAIALSALLGLFAGLGLIAWGATIAFPSASAPQPAPEIKALGTGLVALGGLLFVGTAVFFLINPSYLGNRYVLKLLKREIAGRTGVLVEPNDPDAQFVQIVPKLNWGKLMLQNASDVGFLVVDRGRRQILFEGDKERWRIPAAAITYCEVEEFIEGQGTHGAMRIYYVVLRAARPNQFWEAPIREGRGVGKFRSGKRKKAAQALCARIREMQGAGSLETRKV